jgi:carbon monoxide dehydrogenase subunit G
MRFSNSFEVPLPPEEAWPFLLDIQRIAPCMPGAELTEVVDDSTYKGKVAVRLGPVALSFAGVARFEDVDHAQRKARVKAQGSDVKGRGGANAVVAFGLEPAEGGTRVLIDTDLNLSGSVAQYGRASGMIQSVASQLIGQFATALRSDILDRQPPSAPSGTRAAEAVRTAEPGRPAHGPATTPISGFALLFRAVWDAALGFLKRKGS